MAEATLTKLPPMVRHILRYRIRHPLSASGERAGPVAQRWEGKVGAAADPTSPQPSPPQGAERETVLGLPTSACRAADLGDGHALWLGPDEWLLIGADLAGRIGSALDGIPHSLVEISDRQIAFELSGPDAADVLNAACPLDLDPERFPPGACTRTVFAKAEIVLWRQAEDRFHIEIWRSFADYVRQLLEQVIGEYGGERAA